MSGHSTPSMTSLRASPQKPRSRGKKSAADELKFHRHRTPQGTVPWKRLVRAAGWGFADVSVRRGSLLRWDWSALDLGVRAGVFLRRSALFLFYWSFFGGGGAMRSALRGAILFPDSRRQIAEVFRRCSPDILQHMNEILIQIDAE